MPARSRFLIAFALVLGAVGCGSTNGPSGAANASLAELEWVARYSGWAERFQAAWAGAAQVKADVLGGVGGTTERHLRTAFTRLDTCSSSLAEDVGTPPTPRLRGAEKMIERACASIGRAVDAELTALAGDPGDALLEANLQWSRATEFWQRAEQGLRRLLGDTRRLPVLAAREHASHIDPRLGRAAGQITHDTVEVRCWSRTDWKQVTAVLSALDTNDYVDYAGVASPDERRVSLAPWTCARLADLAYSDERPQSGPDAVDLASAVLTLAHEAVHVRAPGASEAETECYALQEIRRAARALGATPAYADRLAELAWAEVYPLNDAVYSTPACRSGGPLDVDPDRQAWP